MLRIAIVILPLVVVGTGAGCDGVGTNDWAVADGDEARDGEGDGDGDGDGEPDCPSPCGGECCGEGEVCRANECALSSGSCSSAEDCGNDQCCADGACLDFGTAACGGSDPDCSVVTTAGLFQPALQCAWTGPPEGDPFPNHVQVLGTPSVANFDFGGDPDSVHPSIVFNSYDGLDGGSGVGTAESGVVRIIDGRTCELQHSIGPFTNGCNAVAIADLDGNERPEVVLYMMDAAVEAYTYDPVAGTFVRLWESHGADGARLPIDRRHAWTGPAAADLDDDGVPEILAEGTVIDSTGLIRDTSAASTSSFSVVADVDMDGGIELMTGAAVYGWDRAAGTWSAEETGNGAGFVAVADFGTFGLDVAADDRETLDGRAEIAVVHGGSARIETKEGRIVYGPAALPASSGGGPPTIGDFDGDGLPELAAAGSDSYTVFDPDCRGEPDPALCASGRSDGILWSQPSQDHSSNRTGSSLFDFEGDGRTEAVYADEVFVRVYDGVTGEVVYSTYRSSCTWHENPIVADVDGDFNAELVVPSNESCSIAPQTLGGLTYDTGPGGEVLDPLFSGLRCESEADCLSGICDVGICRCDSDEQCGAGTGVEGFVCAPPPAGTPGTTGMSTCRAAWLGPIHGVRVYRDVLDRWVSSRTIWNQHAYAVTAALENGVVPSSGDWDQNWTLPELNNFRQNSQGDVVPGAAADMTARHEDALCTGRGTAELSVRVCNRGAAPVGDGLPVTFYVGDPDDCQVIEECRLSVGRILRPGDCTEVACSWAAPPATATDVTAVADDDGSCDGAVGERECREANNRILIPAVSCAVPS